MAKFVCEYISGITSSGNKKTTKIVNDDIRKIAQTLAITKDYIYNKDSENGTNEPFILRLPLELDAIVEWGYSAPFNSTLEHFNFKIAKVFDNFKGDIPKMRMLDKTGKGSNYRSHDWQEIPTLVLAVNHRNETMAVNRIVYNSGGEKVEFEYIKTINETSVVNIRTYKTTNNEEKRIPFIQLQHRDAKEAIVKLRNSFYLSGLTFKNWNNKLPMF